MKKFISFCLLLALFAFAENPLGLREYQQQFTLVFATDAEAQAAAVTARPLPDAYAMAVSSRWDDTAPSHLTTHKIMVKNGIKGTFFANDVNKMLQTQPAYFKELVSDGSSIGCHTLSHPLMSTKASYEHFREYMGNRIDIEVGVQQAVNAQVLPYCDWQSIDPKVGLSVGWGMRAAGILSTPDVMFPDQSPRMGYPVNALAMSRLLRSGDRNPNYENFKAQLDRALADTAAIALHPSVSMSMHSWCPKDKLDILDRQYALLASHKDWWSCNQNEYGAYRYEALNSKIRLAANGRKVIVTVTRFHPFELGADVPLWFTVQNATPTAAEDATLKGASVKLPHASPLKLPAVIGRADRDGRSSHIPFATLKLSHADTHWTASLANSDMLPLEDISFTFRFPAAWGKENLRQDAESLGSHAEVSITVGQQRKTELMYHYGRPYYAVQVDFTKGDKRYRLFADLLEEPEANLPLTLNDTLSYYFAPEDIDLAQLSQPNAPCALEPLPRKPQENICPGAILPNVWDQKLLDGKHTIVGIVQFTPTSTDAINLATSLRGKGKELWLNGQKLDTSNGKATFAPTPGANRFAMKFKLVRYSRETLFLNGETSSCVKYLK